jgi:hypothetical protein
MAVGVAIVSILLFCGLNRPLRRRAQCGLSGARVLGSSNALAALPVVQLTVLRAISRCNWSDPVSFVFQIEIYRRAGDEDRDWKPTISVDNQGDEDRHRHNADEDANYSVMALGHFPMRDLINRPIV